MKKIAFSVFFVCLLLTSVISHALCLTSFNGLFPAVTFIPTCENIDANVIAINSWAGEISNVNLVAGETYTFVSSNPTDYITISSDDSATASAFGENTITCKSDVNGVNRCYFHLSDHYGEDSVNRIRKIACGTPPALPMPPTNDECINAIVLNCGDFLLNQSTNGATGGTPTSCIGSIGNDVWYSFAGNEQYIVLGVSANSSQDPQIEVYESTDGSCSGFTLGSCLVSAGTGAYNARVSLLSESGKTYYIRIGAAVNGDDVLNFSLFITCTVPPANDECSGAESLTINPDASCSIVTEGTIRGATASPVDATVCGGTEDDDVWYSFVAVNSVQTIFLRAGSTEDLYHSIWTGDCTGLALVPGTCSDENISTLSGLLIGQTYYLRIYSVTGSTGQTSVFNVCIMTPPPPATNDDCTGAIEITAGGTILSFPVIGSTLSATSTVGLPGFSCVSMPVNDVWYSVVVPASGSLTIETIETAGTTLSLSAISIYSGVCGSLVEIGCDDDSTAPNEFSLEVLAGLTPGDVIYIGVCRYLFSPDGNFQLTAYDTSLLSNSSFENVNFKSYPNPVKDVLNLSYNKNISSVAVFNLLGQEVMTKSINSNQSQIDMSGLTQGSYLVKVTADNQVMTIKVIKE